ncbi:hypothetical protein VTO42DRAFT_2212 [Malbranchea cinnamomea]
MFLDSLAVPSSPGSTHVIIRDMSSPVKSPRLARPGMPERYESEEEEVSEADTPSREEHFFSTTDVESDISGFESDTNNDSRENSWFSTTMTKTDDEAVTWRLSMATCRASWEDQSRPTSVYTIKPSRGNNGTGLSPMPFLPSQAESTPSLSSNTTSPSVSPREHTTLTPSTSYEPDPGRLSFYSDPVSSDEERDPETDFLTAIPVTYYTPNSRPNLVSILPSFPRSSDAKVSKKLPKRQKSGLLSRHGSTGSNRSMKARFSRLRLSQYDNRRNSTLVFEVPADAPNSSPPPPFHSLTRSSTHSGARNRHSGGSSTPTSSATSKQSSNRGTKQWPLPDGNSSDRRMSIQTHCELESTRPAPPPPPKEYQSFHRPHVRSSSVKITGYRKPTDVTVPVSNTIGIATSSPPPPPPPPPKNPGAGRSSPQKQTPYRSSPVPPTGASNAPHAGCGKRTFLGGASTPDSWGDPYPSPSYQRLSQSESRTSGERSRSISSMASSSSKFSLPSFDSVSVKAMVHRYRRQHHGDTTATSSTDRSHPRSSPSISKSSTHLGLYPNAPTNFPRAEPPFSSHDAGKQRRSTPSPSQTQHPLRSKSTKWLHSTGETVSQAGSKAISGLGSIIRKKTTSPNIFRGS